MQRHIMEDRPMTKVEKQLQNMEIALSRELLEGEELLWSQMVLIRKTVSTSAAMTNNKIAGAILIGLGLVLLLWMGAMFGGVGLVIGFLIGCIPLIMGITALR